MPRLFYTLYCWLFFVPAFIAITLLLAIPCLLLSLILPPGQVARFTAVPWARCALLLSGVRVELRGLQNLQPGQSYVIVANHLSQFDIFALYGYLGVDFRWVMKQELRRVPVIGFCCELLGHVFIDRSNPAQAIASLNQARAQLSNGTSIVFFPEGTRSRDGQLKPFKKGAFKMAQDLALPILPVTLSGTDQVLPAGSLQLRPGHVAITLHPALPVQGHSETELQQLMLASRAAIAAPLPEGDCPQPSL